MHNKIICSRCHYEETFLFTFEELKLTCPKCNCAFVVKNEPVSDSTQPVSLTAISTDTSPTEIKKLSDAARKLKETLECDLRAAHLINDLKKKHLQNNHEHKLIIPHRRQTSFMTHAQRQWQNRLPWIAVALIIIFMFICGLYLGLTLPCKLL